MISTRFSSFRRDQDKIKSAEYELFEMRYLQVAPSRFVIVVSKFWWQEMSYMCIEEVKCWVRKEMRPLELLKTVPSWIWCELIFCCSAGIDIPQYLSMLQLTYLLDKQDNVSMQPRTISVDLDDIICSKIMFKSLLRESTFCEVLHSPCWLESLGKQIAY